MKPRIVLRALFTLSCALVTSAPARADVLTLAEAEARAIAHDPSVDQADARLAGASAHARTVRASMLPMISADLGASFASGMQLVRTQDSAGRSTWVSGSRTIGETGAFQPFVRYNAGVRIDALQYDFGRTAVRVAGARADARAVEAELEAARETIRERTRAAYLAWLAAHAQRALVELAVLAAEARAAYVDEAASAGARAGADRDVVAYDLLRLRLERTRALAAEDDARYALSALVGSPIEEQTVPDETLLDAFEPATANGSGDASMRALELRREAVAAALRLRRRRHSPVLSGTLRLGISGQNDIFFPTYQAQLLLTVPLWDPRNGDSVRDEALARMSELESQHHALLDAIASEEERVARARALADEEIRLAEQMQTLAERAALAAEERYRTASSSIELVFAARDRLLDAQTQLLAARLDRVLARWRVRGER